MSRIDSQASRPGCLSAGLFVSVWLAFLTWKHYLITGGALLSKGSSSSRTPLYPGEVKLILASLLAIWICDILWNTIVGRLSRGPGGNNPIDRVASIRFFGPIAILTGLFVAPALILWAILEQLFRWIVGTAQYPPERWDRAIVTVGFLVAAALVLVLIRRITMQSATGHAIAQAASEANNQERSRRAIEWLRENAGQGAVRFAEVRGSHWMCVCGTMNPLDRGEKIQNCSRCHRNRDFVLANFSERS